jgi:hypothetical protein
MNKYKLAILLVIVLSLLTAGFIGCGKLSLNEPASPQIPAQSVTPSPSPTQPPAATPQTSTPPPPTSSGELTVISKIIGEVRLLKAGESKWILTSDGTTLEPGDRIKTMKGSNALIIFFDGSSMYLEELTEIGINEASSKDAGITLINIEQAIGKTRSRVNKLIDPASRYEVQTPAGSAVARGSVADITVLWDGTTYILNVEGNWYAYVNGQWIPIPPGTQLNLSTDVPPGVPFIPSFLLPWDDDGGSSDGGGGGDEKRGGGDEI